MKSEEEEEMEGYTMEEFHALLSLVTGVRYGPEYKEFIEKYFADDMTPKQRLEYIGRLLAKRERDEHWDKLLGGNPHNFS